MSDESMPHAEFLRGIQNWVWRRFPARQLSATDIFYALQWAESGVPCCIFTDGFEAWLQTHPQECEKSIKLSGFHFEAERIIAGYRKLHANDPHLTPVIVDDPYEKALSLIAECGRNTKNPLLRDELRIFYQTMLKSRAENRQLYPDWNQRSESFYPLKAHALVDWENALNLLLEHCYNMLSEEEQNKLSMLKPADKIHCMHISEEAQKIYINRILHQNVAEYFEITKLLGNL